MIIIVRVFRSPSWTGPTLTVVNLLAWLAGISSSRDCSHPHNAVLTAWYYNYLSPGMVRNIVMSFTYLRLSVCPSVCSWLGPPLAARCDSLSTSGFLDDVMFSHGGAIARRMNSWVAKECDEHNSRYFHQILPNDNDKNILSVSSALGAKSVIYDCFVKIVF